MKKTIVRILSIIMSVVLMFTAVPVSFSASADSSFTANPLKVEINSDKTEYSLTNTAKFTVKITNVSNSSVENISAETILDGIVPVGRRSELTKEAQSLSAGSSISFNFDAMVDTSKVSVNFFTDFIVKILKFFKGVKSVPVNDFNDGRLYEEALAQISFGGTAFTQSVRVWYDANVELTVNQSNIQTKDINISLDGLAASQVGIEDIVYEVRSENDTTNTVSKGYAMISGDTWSADIKLKTGNNKITITATSFGGASKSVTVDAYYDIGEIATASQSDIATAGDVTYFDGVIAIYFKDTVTEEEARSFIDELGGTVIGENYFLNLYQAKFDIESYKELEEMAQAIEDSSMVIVASVEEFLYTVENLPNDPWDDDVAYADWDNDSVGGSNWGLEAIDMAGAWAYNDRFAENPARIGVIDGNFDYNHAELAEANDNIYIHNSYGNNFVQSFVDEYGNRDNSANHGTHVTGTIAAAANNGRGLTGIVWNADMFLASVGKLYERDNYQDLGWGTSDMTAALSRVVINGAKVINYSAGRTDPTNKNAAELFIESSEFVAAVVKLLDEGFDFLFVQAAGNNGLDALTNGDACGLYGSMDISSITTKYSVYDIMQRTIVVAATENTYSASRGYKLAWYSNYGNRIDVAAPGTEIYSSVANGGYDYCNGTSMAAPHVTAVAGLVWSINRNFTSAEVKRIICGNDTTTKAYGHELNKSEHNDSASNYRMLNAKLAVEKAIALTDAEGIATGYFVDAENGRNIEAGSYTIYKESINGERYDNNVYHFTSGAFSVELPAGKYVLRVEADGYVIKYVTVIIEPFETLNYGDIPITRTLGENQMRIVLSWGENPSDLDSHTVGKTVNGEAFHVVYYNKHFYDSNNTNQVWLDVDDTSSYGPETTTIVDLDELESFTYCVHNYSYRYADEDDAGAYSLADSGARVDVYRGNRQIASYSVPTNRKGTVWNVFSIDSNGVIRRINSFDYEREVALVGSEFYPYSSLNSYSNQAAAVAGSNNPYEK